MKNRISRISFIAAGVFAFALCVPVVTRAQENQKPIESQPSEPPRVEPSAPAPDPPRSDPAPAPAPDPPRNDPAPSAPSSGGSSGSNNDSGSSRNSDNNPSPRDNDSGRRGNDNDNRRSNDGGGSRNSGGGRSGGGNPSVDNSEGGGGRVRGTMTGDGSGNRRDRMIETEDGQLVPPGSVNPGNSGGNGGNSGGDNRGGGGGNRGGGGGNSGGGGNDRHHDRWHDGDRHHNRHDHRHYRGDECYRVPVYDDTISYSANSYPTYDPDASLSAYERGYNDGLYTGANDGRRGQTYDPERSHFYREADHGYSSIGPRDAYQQVYRDGFLRGYREGFQNWQQYFINGRFRR